MIQIVLIMNYTIVVIHFDTSQVHQIKQQQPNIKLITIYLISNDNELDNETMDYKTKKKIM